jgi:hypothetical protein
LETQKAVGLLGDNIDQSQMLKHCMEIHRLESSLNKIYTSGLAELFINVTDEQFMMKWREIFEQMKTVTDKCGNAAKALEAWGIKYS